MGTCVQRAGPAAVCRRQSAAAELSQAAHECVPPSPLPPGYLPTTFINVLVEDWDDEEGPRRLPIWHPPDDPRLAVEWELETSARWAGAAASECRACRGAKQAPAVRERAAGTGRMPNLHPD